MRPIQIIQVSEMEILIHDDDEFLMHLQPHRAEAAGQDFVGLEQPDRWWLKLVMECSKQGHCLWFHQEPRSTNGQPTNGSLISPIGRFTEWNEAIRARLKLANELLARQVQYVVARFREDEVTYPGAAVPNTGWIKPPHETLFILRKSINDREGWEQLLRDARQQARQLDIKYVRNLDPDPD